MTATSENQCTGCGATVTQRNGSTTWFDVSGSIACANGCGELHRVELPPVAIKPPMSIRELANKIMQACIDSPTKFLGESIETILRDELVAIKPEVALTPLEKEMLAVLRGVSNLLAFESQFFIAKLGGMITNGDQARIDEVFISLDAVVAKAEAVQA